MTSFGILAGANLGRYSNELIANGHGLVNLISIAIIFCAVAYVVIGMRRFSFQETIRSVEPLPQMGALDDPVLFDDICDKVAEEYALTPREKEVFALLARGRNGRFIQAELVISYNTAKAHIKNIYAKMGIHSHQEIIDLVEGAGLKGN